MNAPFALRTGLHTFVTRQVASFSRNTHESADERELQVAVCKA